MPSIDAQGIYFSTVSPAPNARVTSNVARMVARLASGAALELGVGCRPADVLVSSKAYPMDGDFFPVDVIDG